MGDNMNTVDILLEKASQNYEIAQIALEKEYFDVAVSRYYYSLFEKTLWLLHKNDTNYSPYKNNGKGSHENTLHDLARCLARKHYNKLDYKECANLSHLNNLTEDVKKYRRIADYDQRNITNDEFDKEFKIKYYSIAMIVDKVISLM
jgi:uncharacterized protein (UPF0332 family)